jgi:hypothetical protein
MFNLARGADKGGRFHLKPRHCPLSLSPTRHPPQTPLPHQTSRRLPYGSMKALSFSAPSTRKNESGSTQLLVPTRGRFHLKLRHCPLALSSTRHPRPCCSNKMSRRGPYGRLRLRLRSCLAPASKNRVQPSSGCRQDVDFTHDPIQMFFIYNIYFRLKI